jgi:hypothetical protein
MANSLAINTYFIEREIMKINTKVKAGRHGMENQHKQTLAHGLKVKTNVRVGEMQIQHNQTAARGLKVKTGIKAGPPDTPIVRG